MEENDVVNRVNDFLEKRDDVHNYKETLTKDLKETVEKEFSNFSLAKDYHLKPSIVIRDGENKVRLTLYIYRTGAFGLRKHIGKKQRNPIDDLLESATNKLNEKYSNIFLISTYYNPIL